MKVLAVKPAAIDRVGSLTAVIRISSTLTIREKRLIRSKKSARLW
jgi:hypothetical protein